MDGRRSCNNIKNSRDGRWRKLIEEILMKIDRKSKNKSNNNTTTNNNNSSSSNNNNKTKTTATTRTTTTTTTTTAPTTTTTSITKGSLRDSKATKLILGPCEQSCLQLYFDGWSLDGCCCMLLMLFYAVWMFVVCC